MDTETKAIERSGSAVVEHMRRMPFDDFQRLAKMVAESKMFPETQDIARAGVKILAGAEMGFGPIASMTGIHIIKGNVTVGANLLAQQVRRHGYDYRIRTLNDTECRIEFFKGDARDGDSLGISTYTWKDAERAALVEKDNWRKFPRNMLFARCMSHGVKIYCPEVQSGLTLYTEDEADAFSEPKVIELDPLMKEKGSHKERVEVMNRQLGELKAQQAEREAEDPALQHDPILDSPVWTLEHFNETERKILDPYLEREHGCDTDEKKADFLAKWNAEKQDLLSEALRANKATKKAKGQPV